MTAAEKTALESLRAEVRQYREELHGYHVEVRALLERCELCRGELGAMQTDVYGTPGGKLNGGGLLGAVADLRRSRSYLLWTVRAVWVVLATLAGLVATVWSKRG